MNNGPSQKTTLEEIARDYGRLVSSVCRRMIQDGEAAEEAAQEAWLEIVRSFASFRGEAKISTWIFTITRRVAIAHARKERVHSTRFLRDYFHGPEREFPDDADLNRALWVKEMCDRCLTGILHCLDNEARLAYIFRDITGLSYEDIAEVFGKDASAVRKSVCRSRRKLRSFLSAECVLFHPGGTCRCRMRNRVREVDLEAEYDKIRNTARRASFYLQSEQVLPKRDYRNTIR